MVMSISSEDCHTTTTKNYYISDKLYYRGIHAACNQSNGVQIIVCSSTITDIQHKHCVHTVLLNGTNIKDSASYLIKAGNLHPVYSWEYSYP